MKKEILQSVKIIVLGLVLSLGISALYAQSIPGWNPAPADPPSDNVAGPIHSGGDQVKQGGLSVNGLLAGNSVFHGSVSLDTLPGQTGNDPLCVDGNGIIKICGISTLNAVWGQTIYSPSPHENYRIVAEISGGTPPYSCTWSPTFDPGSSSTSCHNDLGVIPNGGLSITVSIHDSGSPQQTKNLVGQFYPSH